MENVFTRRINLDELDGVPLSEYTPQQLVAYLCKNYPANPIGALNSMRDNFEVGFVLASQTKPILEVLSSAERN